MILSAPAFADGTNDGVIENVQLNTNPFLASLNVTVGDVVDAAGQVTALGNTLNVEIDTSSATVINNQTVNASGFAESVVNVGLVSWQATSSATTIGNSATITTCCDALDVNSVQYTEVGTSMGAVSNLNVSDWAATVSTSALATGNAIEATTWTGASLNTFIDQTNNSQVTSEAFLDGGGQIGVNAVIASTAIANTGLVGGEQTTTLTKIDQLSYGPEVTATGGIGGAFTPDVEDTVVAVTATGNNLVIENSYGFVSSDVFQDNTATITAQTDINVNTWFGSNSATSYAVGNSNFNSNVGSDILIDNVQFNAGGGVTAITNFNGGNAGGVGDYDGQVISSAAFGNAFSAYNCGACGGGISGTNFQNNSASITSTTSINSGSGGSVIGTATAIGNTATFRSGGGG
ncbi:hypothetical protein MNBD_ALPHA06-1750 [hydrothermal vent metagenome]|uniref:Uncharacterized protein n=1 Tax=hydrothermal vent metagenome TaxID=652676 RepID=A0A3B0RK83_9ZZZZ